MRTPELRQKSRKIEKAITTMMRQVRLQQGNKAQQSVIKNVHTRTAWAEFVGSRRF